MIRSNNKLWTFLSSVCRFNTILDFAKSYVLVHATRIKAGKNDMPACLLPLNRRLSPPCAAIELRRSDRSKRGLLDYSGLDKSSTQKGRQPKRTKKCSPPTNNAQERGKNAIANPSSASSSPAQLHDQNVIKEGRVGDIAAEGGNNSVGFDTTGRGLSEGDVDNFDAFIDWNADATSDDATEHKGVDQATAVRNDGPVDEISCAKLLCSLAPESTELSSKNSAMEVMDTILQKCAEMSHARDRNKEDKLFLVKLKDQEIQSHAGRLADCDYAEAVDAVRKDNKLSSKAYIQVRYNETFYWDIITKGAQLLDPDKLSSLRGPPDEFSKAEKIAAEKFIIDAEIGRSGTSQRRYRRLWKRLSDLRKAGIDKILVYRTTSFEDFCVAHSDEAEISLQETVRSWERLYGPHIRLLESRASKERRGDSSGRVWLSQEFVMQRLQDPEATWNSAENVWFSDVEKANFSLAAGFSSNRLGHKRDTCPGSAAKKDMSAFISLTPRNDRILTVCAIVAIEKGNLLGNFAGMIRYSEQFNATNGIPGPRQNLWLDYSYSTGMLNQMRVSTPTGPANVYLQWELRHDTTGILMWRVAVRALRPIRPFEELVRAAPQIEQYTMHQDEDSARKGFLQAHSLPSSVDVATSQ